LKRVTVLLFKISGRLYLLSAFSKDELRFTFSRGYLKETYLTIRNTKMSKEEECIKKRLMKRRYKGRKTKIKFEGYTVCRKPGF